VSLSHRVRSVFCYRSVEFVFTFSGSVNHLCLLLSLHDALPISLSVMMQVTWFKYTKRKYGQGRRIWWFGAGGALVAIGLGGFFGDRKSTRLNSSHVKISYAVFCLKK